MIECIVVHKGSYHDSAYLMRISRKLTEILGVAEAVVLMGTPMNQEMLQAAGFSRSELEEATPMDLVVAIRARGAEEAQQAQQKLQALLQAASVVDPGRAAEHRHESLRAALEAEPHANLVSVAVPGPYAAYVAHRALDAGRHVFVFSNNVPVAEEVALKKKARKLDLLVMGPDCGTAMIAGVGLGFANRVRRGPIGLVGASGTGIQEITSLIHASGLGVSHAIGTGSADLSAEVGGLMTESGLELLSEDPDTRVIVLVAKHPDVSVAAGLEQKMIAIEKPVVVRYLGQAPAQSRAGLDYMASLDSAACRAVALASPDRAAGDPFCDLEPDARSLLGDRPQAQGRLVGLFGGGSLASEAALVAAQAGMQVTRPDHPLLVEPAVEGTGHLIIDVGDDFYTVGKPHPMVDQTTRCQLIRGVLRDPSVSVLLLDLVLGDGAHPDPAPELIQAIEAGRAERAGSPVLVIASVTGTDLDPQNLARQRRLLASAGVHLQPSAARAARIAALVCGAAHVA